MPSLATDWKFNQDGKTFTLTLRPSLKFSDGSCVTGDDVKIPLDCARNDKNGAWNFLLSSFALVFPSTVKARALRYKVGHEEVDHQIGDPLSIAFHNHASSDPVNRAIRAGSQQFRSARAAACNPRSPMQAAP